VPVSGFLPDCVEIGVGGAYGGGSFASGAEELCFELVENRNAVSSPHNLRLEISAIRLALREQATFVPVLRVAYNNFPYLGILSNNSLEIFFCQN
jgi:hypothetical protein